VVAGVQDLQVTPPLAPALHRFEDVELRGESLRAVTPAPHEPVPFDVVVAETTLGAAPLQRAGLVLAAAAGIAAGRAGAVAAARDPRRPAPAGAVAGSAGAAQRQRPGRGERRDPHAATSPRCRRRSTPCSRGWSAACGRSASSPATWRTNCARRWPASARWPTTACRRTIPRSGANSSQRIAASQARASRLVDQLLDLALALEAQAGLKLEPVELDQLVRDAVLRFLPRADAAGVDLGAVGIDTPCRIRPMRRWSTASSPTCSTTRCAMAPRRTASPRPSPCRSSARATT
jgi:two-component system sensor histidine kinase TctE